MVFKKLKELLSYEDFKKNRRKFELEGFKEIDEL